jgi:Carboxypeptidase regulatory-like domain
MKRFLSLTFFILSSIFAGAQDSTSTAKACSIAGIVVKEPGNQPIKKVLVQVVAENQKQGENFTASTDSDGRFCIEKAVPGRYRIFVERSGFVGVNQRGARSDINVITIQAGQSGSAEEIVLRMLPTAVISGRITDEDGEPMSGVRILVLAKVPGKAKKQPAGSDATNDLGEYRLSGLFPGQYWIAAMPGPDFRDYQSDQSKSQPPDSPGDAHSETRYLTTYYPGTFDAAQATPVTLKAGDEAPVNIMLAPARTYRIRGMVVGVKSGQKPAVELVSKLGDSIHATEVKPDGQFEIRGVGPGSYTLMAVTNNESQTITAHQDVTVVAADVEGVKVIPQAPFAVYGHLSVEGARADLTQYVVNLRPDVAVDDGGWLNFMQESFGTNATVDRAGNFEWKGVNPGSYFVQVYGGDTQNSFFLKSVKVGGREAETGFTASGALTVDALVSMKGGLVEGTVLEAVREKNASDDHTSDESSSTPPNGNNVPPATGVTVVAVPEEKFRKLPDHFGVGDTDQHGRFAIRNLAPGSYTIHAWQDVGESVYHDPDFLKSQEANGTTVKVEEGSRQQIELTVSPIGEDWR